MLDPKFIRAHPEKVRDALRLKGQQADLDGWLALDARRRDLLQELETLRFRQNTASQEIARLKREKQDAAALIEEMRSVSDRIKAFEADLRDIEEKAEAILIWIPNVPHPSVPAGGPENNVEVRRWGTPPDASYKPLAHWEIGEALGILDFKAASKISGSNFSMTRGIGARLERALVNFMLDLHTKRHGYTEVSVPYLVRRESAYGTGQLPKLEEDMYRCEVDDLFLIPTAEVPITNSLRDEILPAGSLPIYLTGYSPCFRRESGAYGRETRGLMRVHQFDKVEMVRFVEPDRSYEELEQLVANAEAVLRALELPYRVVTLAGGDLSFAAAKCYDLEVYAAGEGGRWLEVSSCSNFESFQARRMGIRYRAEDGRVEYVHTLNGSGLALPRTMIALLENFQTAQGTVRVPAALQPYLGCVEIGPGKE
jgi:seryl-tRNA synthetase